MCIPDPTGDVEDVGDSGLEPSVGVLCPILCALCAVVGVACPSDSQYDMIKSRSDVVGS